MSLSWIRSAAVAAVLSIVWTSSAVAQEKREPAGTPLPDDAKVYPVTPDRGPVPKADNDLPNIMVMGYWPPTNEMLRPFSTNTEQNPDGWIGEDWEGRGYNVYSFFPEFPGGLGQGEGDFEVDYQDTSADFWRIVAEVNPIAIVTTGRADVDFDWELEGGHRMYAPAGWGEDYTAPLQPTPELPIYTETIGNVRYSTLPLQAIIDEVTADVPRSNAYSTVLDTSNFLCNFVGYHACWYFDTHDVPGDPLRLLAAGHIHVGSRLTVAEATDATQSTLRALATYLDDLTLPLTPLPEDSLEATCIEDGECVYQSVCVQEMCYAPKHRYLSIARNPDQLPQTARRLSLDGGSPLGWVSAPYEQGGLTLADVVDAPAYADIDFTGDWPDLVHLMGCEVATGQVYAIDVIPSGKDIADEANYSAPLVLPTSAVWGDVVSTCFDNHCEPCDGAVGIDDVIAGISKFQGIDNAPITWVDIDPSSGSAVPNQQVNIGDIFGALGGFQGDVYPGDGPLGCN